MRNFCIFADAVNYIEDNLTEPLSQEEIAEACCCSLSALQKVWRYCSHTSLKEYISKRRLTCCAEEIAKSQETLTEIAMRYQYNSPEVFSRAFRKFWGITPSKFRSVWHSTGLFPKIIPDESRLKGGVYMGKKVDISELYDRLKEKPDSIVLCFDVVGLTPVNKNLGSAAGDSVIREAFRRIDEAAGSEMTAFRIGGDEFVIVTGLVEKTDAEKTADKVLSLNGNEISCDGNNIPVSLRVSALRLRSEHLRYSGLFDRLQRSIDLARDNGKVIWVDE